ncbi:MAG: CRISPR-associated endonuclease Cas1 [Acidobacteriota bacterium]
MPATVAIVGDATLAVDLAIRRSLKTSNGEIAIVLDMSGRGASMLSDDNKRDLDRREVTWFDAANRQRPSALFQIGYSPHFARILARTLEAVTTLSRLEVTKETIDWAVAMAGSIVGSGTVGLGSLLRCLANPEIWRRFIDTSVNAAAVQQDRLLQSLQWALRYPAVYGVSEGKTVSSLIDRAQESGVVWIEAVAEHFEVVEHALVLHLIDAAVENAVKVCIDHKAINDRSQVRVVRLLPPPFEGLEPPDWVRETAARVRHVSVHHLNPDRVLKSPVLGWVSSADELCVLKPARRLSPVHRAWLTDAEIECIDAMPAGAMWIRSKADRKSIVVEANIGTVSVSVAQRLRFQAAQGCEQVQVRQMSSALSTIGPCTREADLYRRLADSEFLRTAWFRVQSGPKESAGVDHVTIAGFKDIAERELAKLSYELRTGRYQSRPLLRVHIPKSDGGKRPLGICCVRDRIVQTAILLVLEPIFEPTFSHFSFAFRPRRSAHHALTVARSFIAAGHEWAVIADIKKCFDNIDHDVLLRLLSQRIADPNLLDLIRQLLTVDVLDFHDMFPSDLGVPQGESLSPFLSNVYLDPLDRRFEALLLPFVRYADDILLFARDADGARRALEELASFLREPLHLELKPAKTNYQPVSQGVDFLGFRIFGKQLIVQPARIERAAGLLRPALERLGNRALSFLERSAALGRINSTVRGFRNYFGLPDEPEIEAQLRRLDGTVEEMALELLPVEIREDPAWICRERFCMPQPELTTEATLTPIASALLDVYPEDTTVPRGTPAETGVTGVQAKGRSTVIVGSGSDALAEEQEPQNDGVLKDRGRLYLLANGSYLSLKNDRLVVKRRKSVVYETQLHDIGLIFLQGLGMTVAVQLQIKLAEMDIPLVLAPLVGPPVAVLNPILSTRSFLRGQQVLRRDDPDVVQAALRMLAAKCGNQAAVLRYFGKYRKKTDPTRSEELAHASRAIRDLGQRITLLDPSTPGLRSVAMGYEGQAAALYWAQLIQLVPESLGFSGRCHSSPKDVVNQCINYVYGILYGEVWRAVVKAGLDPYFGLVHGSHRDQGSLVFDLIEEFRAPFADRLVLGMLGRGFVPKSNSQGLLRTSTRRRLAAAFNKSWRAGVRWRSASLTPAALLERQAVHLANLIKGESTYQPYRMRW